MESEMEKMNLRKLKRLVVKRNKNSHKGDYGKVLIIAGSKGMTGAAVLAGYAALKAGAGLVTIACPASEQSIIAVSLPEIMTLPLSHKNGSFSFKAANELLRWQKDKKYDLALIGPGLSVLNETPKFVFEVIKKLQVPVIIDADALNALSGKASFERILSAKIPRIMTPHSGEIKRLLKTKIDDRKVMAADLAEKTGAVIVMKGNKTMVRADDEFYENASGGPELAKGGSGDVLAGLMAGLWAQSGKLRGYDKKTAFESAALGVYLHGLCGDLAREEFTERCAFAGELMEFLPAAYKSLARI